MKRACLTDLPPPECSWDVLIYIFSVSVVRHQMWNMIINTSCWPAVITLWPRTDTCVSVTHFKCQEAPGLKSEAKQTCFKAAFSLTASRGRRHRLFKEVWLYRSLTEFMTSVKCFWSQSLVLSSFSQLWSIYSKIDDKAASALVRGVVTLCRYHSDVWGELLPCSSLSSPPALKNKMAMVKIPNLRLWNRSPETSRWRYSIILSSLVIFLPCLCSSSLSLLCMFMTHIHKEIKHTWFIKWPLRASVDVCGL